MEMGIAVGSIEWKMVDIMGFGLGFGLYQQYGCIIYMYLYRIFNLCNIFKSTRIHSVDLIIL